jgi:hypothetical protein
MSHHFSQKLIQETIETLKMESGVVLSPQEASDCLFTLAGMYLAFSEKGAGSGSLERDGPLLADSPDLLIN